MSYAKLFSSILDSTIWREEPHVKVVWITMLAMADRTGVVQASVPGLADRAKVTLGQCVEALDRLKAPDEWSRTKEYHGRRIEEIDGGWLVLNYEKHRSGKDMDEERDAARVRAKVYRQNQRARAVAAGDYPVAGDKCRCCDKPFMEPFRLFVVFDHDHSTGHGRAYICQSCNKLVGQRERGKQVPAEASAFLDAYLARFSASREVTAITPSSRTITVSAKPAPAPEPSTSTKEQPSSASALVKVESEIETVAWSRAACDDWIARFGGTAPGGQIGKALVPLVKRHGWPFVRKAWVRYLAQSEAQYASPSRFSATFGRWSGISPDPAPQDDATSHNARVLADYMRNRPDGGLGSAMKSMPKLRG